MSDPEFVAWATEIGFLTEDGYFGPVDEDGFPLRLPPITGYADFSDFAPQQVFDLDGAMVDSLLAECVGDQDPRFADGIGPDGRFFWGQLPEGLDQSGFATYVACMEGLNKPDPVPWTDEQWAESYAYTMAHFDCEEGFGAVWPSRPSLEEWIAADGSWDYDFDPYEDLETALNELQTACPSSPVGGFGAWDPGDPVVSIP